METDLAIFIYLVILQQYIDSWLFYYLIILSSNQANNTHIKKVKIGSLRRKKENMYRDQVKYIRYSKQQLGIPKINQQSDYAIIRNNNIKQQQSNIDKQDKFKEQLLTSNLENYDIMKYDQKAKQRKKHGKNYQFSEMQGKQASQQDLCEWQTFSNRFFDKSKNRVQSKEPQIEQIEQSESQIFSTLKKYKPLVIRNSNQIRKNELSNELVHLKSSQSPIEEELSSRYRYTFLKNHISNQALIIRNKSDAIDQQRQKECIKRNQAQRKPKQLQLSFKLPAIDKSQQKMPCIHNINKINVLHANPKTGRYSASNAAYILDDKISQIQGMMKQGKVRLYSYRQFFSPSKLEQEAVRIKLLKRKQRLFQLGKMK